MANNPDRLTYKEAVAYCGFKSEFPLRRAVRRKELQRIDIGYRIKFFEKTELDRWMASKKTKIIRQWNTTSPSRSAPRSRSSSSPSPSDGLEELSTRVYESEEN
jgi:hypothetical protein